MANFTKVTIITESGAKLVTSINPKISDKGIKDYYGDFIDLAPYPHEKLEKIAKIKIER